MGHRQTPLDEHVFTIKDLAEAGSLSFPKMYSDYYNEGASDMVTLKDNEAAYDRYKLRTRVLRGVGNLDTSTTIWGKQVLFPFGFSPAALHGLAHPEGELATSRAAAKNNIAMGLSSYSTRRLEDVIAYGEGNPYGMHICFYRDRTKTLDILKRADAAGYKAAIITCDSPVLGLRINEYRNNFDLPPGINMPMLQEDDSVIKSDTDALTLDPNLILEEAIQWTRSHTKMQIWVKGLMSPLDVQIAVDNGVDGILISNHGGRQLDGVPATLDVLRECAPIAKGKALIAVDGGIRRGSDIFKAIALGADFCFAGRIPIWGLGYKGEEGVDLAIKLLYREFCVTMALCGCRTVAEITKDRVSVLQCNGVLSKL